MDATTVRQFQSAVWEYYHQHGRHDMPWRQPDTSGRFDPYKIMVSEIMLQQTQVARVIPKYHEFLAVFPSVQALARAELGDVIRAWAGLGYNRRAKFLWLAAQQVQAEYAGTFPVTIKELVALPGIGKNTAGAILAYAYNQPVSFVETNVRTVYIHHFFKDRTGINDAEILELVNVTLPDNVREWYWALMDYGTHLKKEIGNLNKLSKHYTKQSRFEGSARQVRGQIIRLLHVSPQDKTELKKHITDDRLPTVLQDLVDEGLIRKVKSTYSL